MSKRYEDYFDIDTTRASAKCLKCSQILKISQRSKTGLKGHLLSKHGIDLDAVSAAPQIAATSKILHAKPGNNRQPESQASETSRPPTKKRKIDEHFAPRDSMDKKVSRMVAKDGLTFSVFTTSPDLRDLFHKSGFDLPKSANTVRNVVVTYSKSVKSRMIIEIQKSGDENVKHSLTFDEWTSKKNRRYLNINLHSKEKHYNLGLVPINGSCTAETCVELLKNRLKSFELDLENDIVGITTDGARVMQKVGKLLSCYQQLCYAHGVQLAITDVLYKQTKSPEAEEILSDNDHCDSDNDIEENDSGMTVHFNSEPVELIPTYSDLVKKVRAVVKIFKKSPVKNDSFLQKYVQEELKKRLELVLDCKTRWSSLFFMLDRFILLRTCISKALIDINSDLFFSEDEWSKLVELKSCLEPLKLGVEALCRQDATLITAEATLRFMVKKLQEQSNCLSENLAAALQERIIERRSVELTGTLLYLQDPNNLYHEAGDTFKMPKKSVVRATINKILRRILTNEANSKDSNQVDNFSEVLQPEKPCENFSLKEELECELRKSSIGVSSSEFSADDLLTTIRKEMSAFESSGSKGKYLTLADENLRTIKPTSVESERAFSAAGYLCNELRTRLSDGTIDTLCFLRSYFQIEAK